MVRITKTNAARLVLLRKGLESSELLNATQLWSGLGLGSLSEI